MVMYIQRTRETRRLWAIRSVIIAILVQSTRQQFLYIYFYFNKFKMKVTYEGRDGLLGWNKQRENIKRRTDSRKSRKSKRKKKRSQSPQGRISCFLCVCCCVRFLLRGSHHFLFSFSFFFCFFISASLSTPVRPVVFLSRPTGSSPWALKEMGRGEAAAQKVEWKRKAVDSLTHTSFQLSCNRGLSRIIDSAVRARISNSNLALTSSSSHLEEEKGGPLDLRDCVT